jgi:hypothetical protein
VKNLLNIVISSLVSAVIAATVVTVMADDEPTPDRTSEQRIVAGSAFTYQGQLDTASGPATGSYDFEFRLFDALTGGTQVATIPPFVAKSDIAVTNGLFSVDLDFGSATGVFDGNARWLEVSAKLHSDVNFESLVPRQPLNPTPYALFSLKTGAHNHIGETWTGSFQGNSSTNKGILTAVNTFAGNFGTSARSIGLKGEAQTIGVFGELPAHGPNPGVDSNSLFGGVLGFDRSFPCDGTCVGVTGFANQTSAGGNSIGVHGGGGTVGVLGSGFGTTAIGVQGVTFGSGAGVKGTATNGPGVHGTATQGYGILGQSSGPGVGAESTNDDGVRATSLAAGKSGVFARNDNSTSAGVWGVSHTNGTNGIGVYGSAGSTTAIRPVNTGVYGYSSATSGTGVYGRANGQDAVGVKGVAPTSAEFAGYFSGKVEINGTCICTLSDARLKKDVASVDFGLEQLLALHPVDFRWNQEGDDQKLHAGFIAQEAREVAPQLVLEGSEGTLHVDPMAFIAMTVKAIQEQQAQIEEMRGTSLTPSPAPDFAGEGSKADTSAPVAVSSSTVIRQSVGPSTLALWGVAGSVALLALGLFAMAGATVRRRPVV